MLLLAIDFDNLHQILQNLYKGYKDLNEYLQNKFL